MVNLKKGIKLDFLYELYWTSKNLVLNKVVLLFKHIWEKSPKSAKITLFLYADHNIFKGIFDIELR